MFLTPVGASWTQDPVPVVLHDVLAGWAVGGGGVVGALVEPGANWKLVEGKLDDELVLIAPYGDVGMAVWVVQHGRITASDVQLMYQAPGNYC